MSKSIRKYTRNEMNRYQTKDLAKSDDAALYTPYVFIGNNAGPNDDNPYGYYASFEPIRRHNDPASKLTLNRYDAGKPVFNYPTALSLDKSSYRHNQMIPLDISGHDTYGVHLLRNLLNASQDLKAKLAANKLNDPSFIKESAKSHQPIAKNIAFNSVISRSHLRDENNYPIYRAKLTTVMPPHVPHTLIKAPFDPQLENALANSASYSKQNIVDNEYNGDYDNVHPFDGKYDNVKPQPRTMNIDNDLDKYIKSSRIVPQNPNIHHDNSNSATLNNIFNDINKSRVIPQYKHKNNKGPHFDGPDL